MEKQSHCGWRRRVSTQPSANFVIWFALLIAAPNVRCDLPAKRMALPVHDQHRRTECGYRFGTGISFGVGLVFRGVIQWQEELSSPLRPAKAVGQAGSAACIPLWP